MKRVNRSQLRGKPLDDDCKKARTTTNEYGENDNRVFCYGLFDCMYIDIADKCIKCKAYVDNAEPLESGVVR